MSALRKWLRPSTGGSVAVAKDRLRLVLVHNRLNMSPEKLDSLKNDLVAVLSRYFDVERDSLAVDVHRGDQKSQIITTISVKQQRKAP